MEQLFEEEIKNNMNKLCAICHRPMKLIPAGFSKATGKPYNEFWACADRTHKQPREPKPNTPDNDTMKIIGEILADLQVKIELLVKDQEKILELLNRELLQE